MARIRLVYPKMPGSSRAPLERCIAFEKYDGTNLHWVWERELGWYAFGTRRDRFDLDDSGVADFIATHAELEEAPHIFQHSLANQLIEVFRQRGFYDSAEITAFTEFLGPNSFAGRHREDDEKTLILFDICTAGGFLDPDTFVDHFSSSPIPRVVYRGRLTGAFSTAVREGQFGVAEGVVCKGGKRGSVWMVKIKTDAYKLRLKEAFASNWENYWE